MNNINSNANSENSSFQKSNAINVNEYVEKKRPKLPKPAFSPAGGKKNITRIRPMRSRAAVKKQPSRQQLNKTIIQCLVKNNGMFGPGLYLYPGKELPDPASGTDSHPAAPPENAAAAVQQKPENKQTCKTEKIFK